MAVTSQLRLVFGTMNGERTWTYKNIRENTTAQQVKNLMNVMIDNGSIYKYPPLSKVSATRVVTSTESYDISD